MGNQGLHPGLALRPATLEDVPTLERWDRQPHVISATTDDADATQAYDHDWRDELRAQSELSEYVIAELHGRPIGVMQIIDPREEPTHYWGEVEPNLRAMDIWIGDAADLGKGYGETMMRLAFLRCFGVPAVEAIIIDPLASNTRAHAFYRRLGFVEVGRQRFGDDGEDDCLIHRLSREAWRARFPEDRA
jgi:aminoglycoside 6'-N-acetyltransferase